MALDQGWGPCITWGLAVDAGTQRAAMLQRGTLVGVPIGGRSGSMLLDGSTTVSALQVMAHIAAGDNVTMLVRVRTCTGLC